jgi:hypothetical protein
LITETAISIGALGLRTILKWGSLLDTRKKQAIWQSRSMTVNALLIDLFGYGITATFLTK